MDLKEEHLLGDQVGSHWYYQSKLAALRRAIADVPVSAVLDVGAGSGFFSRALLADGKARAATCVDPNYSQERDETVAGRPLHFRRRVSETDADLVLMMDVIEHVPDDGALVADYVAAVRPGTRFLVTVPAFQWLWSGHDVFLEHYRRYDLAQLEAVLASAGLRVERGHYFYGAVLPLVAGVRLWKRATAGDAPPASDMRRETPLVNRLLAGIGSAETRLMRWNRLGGTSVFARAIKP